MPNLPPLKPIDLNSLSRADLEAMDAAGEQINDCYRLLKKGSINIVGECLKDQGTFFQMEHYPQGDVYDSETFAQYYYHNHREDMDEHGHFHTFMRAGGINAGTKPVPYDGEVKWELGKDAVSHVICISMDKAGFPIGLFATNRWVTGETWYKSEDVVTMLDNWVIDHAFPNLSVNLWITGMMRLFRPQIVELLHHRDQVVQSWADENTDNDVFEDRKLEVTGEMPISVEKQHELVKTALSKMH